MRQLDFQDEQMSTAKPFIVPKRLIWDAWKQVKANGGAGGVDDVSLSEYEEELEGNLYKLWNRMSSGSYMPPPVKAVPIPKKPGGTRVLGVPTVADRVAQTAVKIVLEPVLDPLFHPDSYGYRPGKSAHDALETTRKRCWKYDWVVEFDIRGLFDNIDHQLLMRAVRKHCDTRWVLLYIERWLTAPLREADGDLCERTRGTPQGGVVSPLLANLFLHYAFDVWVSRVMPHVPFCRYADDGLLHCKSQRQAEFVLERVAARFRECGLEIHPDKTKIVYCQDVNRTGSYEIVRFEFLGFDFRPRKAVDKYGRIYVNFSPAVSRSSLKAMHRKMRSWHIQLKNGKSLTDLSHMFNPVLRGWMTYYGKFYASAMYLIWQALNLWLTKWIMRKWKRFARHKRRARHHLGRLARANPRLFVHWEKGIIPAV
jgi:RNA-directed DNA polymerase